MPRPSKAAGSVALVTGANRGIGLAFVRELAARGAKKVYAGVRSPDALAGEFAGLPAEVVPLDVTDQAAVAAAANACPDVNLLVNNAGLFTNTRLVRTTDPDAARREMEVNYFGVLRVLTAFAAAVGRRGGVVVNVGSAAGLSNVPLQPTYSASKAAQHSLTQAARALLAAQGVSVHGVYPGPVDTEMTKDLPPQFVKTPPGDVAEAILDGVEAGEDDIFPDPFAAAVGKQFYDSPKAVERQMAALVSP